jgi:hypothetical protein
MADWMREIGSGFERWQLLLLLGLQCLGPAIWCFQNSRSDRLGGRISFIKAHWLAYAIVLWLVVPGLLATRHWTMLALSISVGIRAMVELPLCLGKRWKVAYGMAHNVLHLMLCAVALWSLAGDEQPRHFLLLLVALTVLSLVTEIIFVSWFRRATEGPEQGIYFVPGGKEFRQLNRATGWLFLPQYVIFITVLALNCIVNFFMPS